MDVELRRAMVDAMPSLTIIPLSILETVRVSPDRVVKQPISVSSFQGTSSTTLAHINLKLIIGPTRTVNKFHIIGAGCPSDHVILGRPWIHQHKVVKSTCYQFVKVFWKGKKIHICINVFPFQQDEAHFSEAAFLVELAEDEEAVPSKPQVSLRGHGRASRKESPGTPSRLYLFALLDQQSNKGGVPVTRDLIERSRGRRFACSIGGSPTFMKLCGLSPILGFDPLTTSVLKEEEADGSDQPIQPILVSQDRPKDQIEELVEINYVGKGGKLNICFSPEGAESRQILLGLLREFKGVFA